MPQEDKQSRNSGALQKAIFDLCVARAEIDELKEKNGRLVSNLKEVESSLSRHKQREEQGQNKYMDLLEEVKTIKVASIESLPTKRTVQILVVLMALVCFMQFIASFYLLTI